ncbi:arginine N-succinyltransferase [Rheinheimera sediminis]|uniref:arginine N-succinyltransferase n=1 Tax=Rheinheimera sp. YQF-1 TaxID=2499626 RepID=UPI000FD8C5C8|nr:arginine N-succinyltransferase [Rheinheimera sp. YQF-1]RVT44653.1 arginine N-succinyltransferase [Rheinheimera sp. YQF-1]
MLLIRPIRQSDYPVLMQIAIESGAGFTSLPVNDQKLQAKIARSEQSFATAVEAMGDQGYVFVLEDTSTGEIVGTSGIEASVGLENPLYHFHKSTVVHHSKELDVFKQVEVLTMCNDYTGVSEICTLFLREPYRQGLNGRFLSKVRFLFMAEHPKRFSKMVIAEMRGVADDSGLPPFWKWLQSYFFSIDFPTADYMIGVGNKGFIADLMPRHPIYVSLLPESAQQVIGEVHENTKPALALLENEGFFHRGYVDLFDGGPTVECQLKQIKSVRNSHKVKVLVAPVEGNATLSICNTHTANFRAVFSKNAALNDNHELVISPELAEALMVSNGDFVRYLSLEKAVK